MQDSMGSTSRSFLFTTSLYFGALGCVAVGLYTGLSTLAPAVQAHFLHGRERPQSRLDVMTANAREIRQALATPVAVVEPLQPITARPMRDVAAKPAHKVPTAKLSAQARDAFASFDRPSTSQSSHMVAAYDRFRPQ